MSHINSKKIIELLKNKNNGINLMKMKNKKCKNYLKNKFYFI